MATRLKAKAAALYDEDFYLWTRDQAAAIREGRWADLDTEHLAEEVDDLGDAKLISVRSRSRTIIEHLLKLEHSPAADPRRGWRQTIRRQRRDIIDDLTPTIRRQLAEQLPDLYRQTTKHLRADLIDYGEQAAAEPLPTECPYTLEQILGDWLPPQPARET